MNNQNDNWYLYILKCSDDSLYTGIAKDPIKRCQKHMRGKGAKYTRSRLPVTLLLFEAAGTKGNALSVEYRFKRLKRSEKLLNIETAGMLREFIQKNQKNEQS